MMEEWKSERFEQRNLLTGEPIIKAAFQNAIIPWIQSVPHHSRIP
jgi:hypothetical protein